MRWEMRHWYKVSSVMLRFLQEVNMRGLQTKVKNIIDYINVKHLDIVCMPEIGKWNSNLSRAFERKWDGIVYKSTIDSKGAGIMYADKSRMVKLIKQN
jgi:hypothetical protein